MRLAKLFPGVLLAVGLAAAANAEVATKKYDWNPINGAQDIDVTDGTIVVSQVEFDLGSTLKGTPIRKSSAKVKVRVDNNGQTDEETGIAVVVFDAEGNVVAAGSNGTKWGYLGKGNRTYYDIDFPYSRALANFSGIDQATGKYVYSLPTDKNGNYAPGALKFEDQFAQSRWFMQVTLRYEF